MDDTPVILGPDGQPIEKEYLMPTRLALLWAKNTKGIFPDLEFKGECQICSRNTYLVKQVFVRPKNVKEGDDRKGRVCFDCYFIDNHKKEELPKRNELCLCGSGEKFKQCCNSQKS